MTEISVTDQGNAERLRVIEWLTRSQAICHCEMAVKYFREMVREENENKSIHINA